MSLLIVTRVHSRLTFFIHLADKVAPSHRHTAHTKFQEIAFAYAILSDATRRDRYDTTGSTSESLSDDFNWASYFKAQYAETVTVDKLNNLKSTYQGSEEEKCDVLNAYKRHKGNLNKVFKDVMMSNALVDEDRFREYIDGAIAAGEVQGFDAYVKEAKKARKERKQVAEREGTEAKQYAKKLGVYESLFGDGRPEGQEKKGLADLIQQKQKERAATFLDDPEAKYGGKGAASGKTNGKKRKSSDEQAEENLKMNGARQRRRKAAKVTDESSDADEGDDPMEEPPEEAFRAVAARTLTPQEAQPATEDSDAEESLGDEDSDEEEVEEEEEEDEVGGSEEDEEADVAEEHASEEEGPKPARKTRGKPQAQRGRSNTKLNYGRK